MALLQLASLPNSFTNMLPLERKSLFIASKPFQCRASNNSFANSREYISRRSANFQPSLWSYDYIQSLSSEYMGESYKEQSRMLREEIRIMLSKVVNHVDQLELIDVLQRLGVAYHFINEIRNILDRINNMDTPKGEKNLHATALEFRLLRQHCYNISTDVFVSFLDEAGNFKKCHSFGAKEMLSLYEATFHSFEDETIMNKARDFTLEFLKEYLTKNKGNHLSLLTSHALELPLHWRIDRWEARWFIDAYRRRENMSPAILQLAIVDFNIVQAIYQEELKYTSRWWKRIGLAEKLSFTRDRLVQNYVWTVGTNFKPNFRNFREVITKVNSLITTIDDIYDVYGTFEELQLFTEAMDRWDPKTIDNLPDYMKICFLALYNFVNELGHEILKENGCDITPYLKEAREKETGDIPKSIQCYMNETRVSEKEACEYMKSMMHTTWKKMNEEACNSSFPESFIDVAINLAKMALCMYQHGDGHTIQDPKINSRIVSLIFQPIPDLYAQKSS
ncbi:PREDICTED: myrcene synthase, chloroplastic-like isoform X2 [Lupinus angustifolius]|uniref:myrcene synthase, chloroplastic-like isoform X2 n=1 Tax=Lupinus angustifolius TaxID=3871 RepID=UPI00092F7123|nr:PREDICTED: myrcene synthase, chloroplastic-like isoform X2 [Lupinus angustifolius]